MSTESHLAKLANRLARNEKTDLFNRSKVDSSNSILLLDTSGSMCSHTDTQEPKIEALRKVVYSMRGEGLSFRQIIFGDTVEMREDIPEPGGSTPLREAIELSRQYEPQRLVVISDGIPDDAPGCLTVGKNLNVPIDTFYVGPRPNAGEGFLAELSRVTGGTAHVGDLGTGLKSLAGEVKKALGALNAAPVIVASDGSV